MPTGINMPAETFYINNKHAGWKVFWKQKLGPKYGHITYILKSAIFLVKNIDMNNTLYEKRARHLEKRLRCNKHVGTFIRTQE